MSIRALRCRSVSWPAREAGAQIKLPMSTDMRKGRIMVARPYPSRTEISTSAINVLIFSLILLYSTFCALE
jgi:hypothetical protein